MKKGKKLASRKEKIAKEVEKLQQQQQDLAKNFADQRYNADRLKEQDIAAAKDEISTIMAAKSMPTPSDDPKPSTSADNS